MRNNFTKNIFLDFGGLLPPSRPVMKSSRTCPWPRGSLRTHFQVLGLGLGLVAHVLGLGLGLESQVLGLESQVLGLGLVKFSMTHRCTDTASKKVLLIRA